MRSLWHRQSLSDLSAKPKSSFVNIHELNDSKRFARLHRVAIYLCLYLILGIGYYHGQEGISIGDSIYFTVVTLATVGYGDITPHGRNNKIFTCVFVLLGVSLIGYCLSILGTVIVENDERMKLKHQKRMKRIIDRVNSMKKTKEKLEMELSGNPILDGHSGHNNTTDQHTAQEAKNLSLTAIKELSNYSFEYAVKKLKFKAIRSVCVIALLLFIASITMAYVYGYYCNVIGFMSRRWRNGVQRILFIGQLLQLPLVLYLIIIVSCGRHVVGYGDITPRTVEGRAITTIYIIVGYTLLGKCISEVVNYPSVLRYKKNELRVIQQFTNGLSGEGLAKLIDNNFINEIPNLKITPKDTISKLEFVMRLLQLMGKISPQDILLASKTFDNLDENCDGLLQQSELEAEMERTMIRESIQESMQSSRPTGFVISETIVAADAAAAAAAFETPTTPPTMLQRFGKYFEDMYKKKKSSRIKQWDAQGADRVRRLDKRGSLFGTSPLITPRDEEANNDVPAVRPEDVEGVLDDLEDTEQSEDDVGIY